MAPQPHDPAPDSAIERTDLSFALCSRIPDTYALLLS
jgi:hypothetical protein